MYYSDDYISITECIINGIKMKYDACSSNTLEHALNYYKDYFEYIGSGTGEIYINGKKNMFNGIHHFFIKTNLTFKQKRKLKLQKLNTII